MQLSRTLMTCLATGLLTFAGCGQGETAGTATPTIDGTKFLLAEEPAGASNVIEVKAAAKDADEVVMVGRIGGSHSPWVEGMAAFTVVDPSLKACSDIEGDMCKTPWDYCCEPDVGAASVLVKVVDENGQVVQADARKLLNVKELTTVVVRGTAELDDSGKLFVLANGIHVRK